MRSKTWVARDSLPISVSVTGRLRQSHSGTSDSRTDSRSSGTLALRKYFWAKISIAICDHAAGASISSFEKTREPSGLRISLTAARKAMPS